MNKSQLIDALAERLGDRKVAATAVAGLVDVVIRTVHSGERVTITGFGVFEKRARAARTARNPRTGQTVTVQQTDVPAFRPGTLFREVVSGTRTLPSAGASRTAAAVPPVAASPSPPINPPASSNSRPATRMTAATHLTSVHVAETKAAKAGKTVKAAKAEPKVSAKGAAEALSKAELKATTKAATKAATKTGPKALSKGTAKKAGKKSAAKK